MSKTTAKPTPEWGMTEKKAQEVFGESAQPRQNWKLRIRVLEAPEIRDTARNMGLLANIENTERGREVVVEVTDYTANDMIDLIAKLTQDYEMSNG